MLGFVLMIVFIGIAVTSGLRVFSDAVDVRVPGQSQVDLPPNDEKMVWARPGDTRSCTTTDTSGRDLPLDPSGSVSVSINGDEWVGVGTFPTGNGHVILECDGNDGVIRIANTFGGWGFIGSILGAVLAPAGVQLRRRRGADRDGRPARPRPHLSQLLRSRGATRTLPAGCTQGRSGSRDRCR